MEHNSPYRPSIRQCMERIASETGVSVEEMRGLSRKKHIVHARHAAMYEARSCTGKSLPIIGRAFNRDHTTVINGIAKHSTRTGAPSLTEFNIQRQELSRARYRENYWRREAVRLRELLSAKEVTA